MKGYSIVAVNRHKNKVLKNVNILSPVVFLVTM
jgi:hypothetical protein